MKPLAHPVPAEEIERELGRDSLIAGFRGLEIHLVAGVDAPATLDEIGRIREQEYRRVGAGRGEPRDLDRFDTEWPAYLQLVSWDPTEREVVAAYRAIRCDWAIRHGGPAALRTAGLFEYRDRFVHDYLASSVELGRSVVNAEARKAVSGLFSVWVGLGAMVREWPGVRYFFGNVSLYRSLPEGAVRAVVAYLLRNHAPAEELVRARHRLSWVADLVAGESDFEVPSTFEGLQSLAARDGWPIPPILVSYVKANPGMLAFDVAEDGDFGGAFEVAIAVPVAGLAARTVDRFLTPYVSTNPDRFVLPPAPPVEPRR
ncbi:MAG: GNAT family N-acetyltransferase [Spirochaetaceae bacterium]|nr:MAG: GNAT family N-acetyltransferase [Spirochaetaceae bacterium]